MSRSVNKTQIDIILDRMQSNRSIACGLEKVSKEVLADFWNNLTEDLNNAGPPIKNVTEWKKVWTDQKRYVRSKAAANLRYEQEMGGGTNQIKRLSLTEQSIYNLVGMKQPVEAIENRFSFGLSDSYDYNDKSNEERKPFIDEIPVEVLSDISTFSKTVTTTKLQQNPFTSTDESSCYSEDTIEYSKRKRRKFTASELTAKKFKSEDNLYNKMTEIGDCIQEHNKKMEILIKEIDDSIKNHNKKMEMMMKRIYRSVEEKDGMKSKKVKELERHHKVCEFLRLKEVESKIERNKKLMEIEEIKILKMKRKSFN